MKTFKKLFVIFFSSIAISIQAQNGYLHNSINSVPTDPDISKLSTFGNIDMTLNKGLANVNIPIYTAKGLSIDYPISLTYDGQGIKVNERAGIVGLNWTLNGIGVISRMINGMPDDMPSVGFNTLYQLNETLPMVTGLVSTEVGYNHRYAQNGYNQIDLLPDEFRYSFLGKNGGFYYNPKTAEQGFKTMPFSKLKIEKLVSFPELKYKITDENGYVFYFLDFGTSQMNSPTDMAFNFSDYPSQCYLTKIESPNGSIEMEFEYAYDNESNPIHLITNGYEVIPPQNNYSITTQHSYYSRKSKLLKKIITPSEDLIFSYSNRNDDNVSKLQSIVIKNKMGIQIQKRELHYSYFNPIASNGSNQFLKLESIDFSDAINNIKSSYSLEYEGGDLANMNSKSIDRWGFYNGMQNSTLTETHWSGLLNNVYYGANREPNLNNSKIGILKKIIYPTGGNSEFEYELNDYGFIDDIPLNDNEPIYTTSIIERNFIPSSINNTTIQTFTLPISGVFKFNSKREVTSLEPIGTIIGIIKNSAGNVIGSIFTQTAGASNNSTYQTFEGAYFLPADTYTIELTTDDQFNYGKCTYHYPSQFNILITKKCGGLRIKQIKNFDPFTNKTSYRNFSYISSVDPTRSSGIVPNIGNHTGSFLEAHTTPPTPISGSSTVDYWITHNLYFSEPFNSLFYADGSPIIYNRVVEGIGLNNEGGYIEHLFSNANDLGTGGGMYSLPKSNMSWKRGLPIQKKLYNSNNLLIFEENNNFTTNTIYNKNTLSGQKFFITGHTFCMVTGDHYRFTSASKQLQSNWHYRNSSISKSYDINGNAIENAIQYYYDNPLHIQVTRIKSLNSEGNERTRYFKYPLDYSPNLSSDYAIDALNKMVEKNIHAVPVEELTTLKKNGIEKITNAKLTKFKEFEPNKIYPESIYNLEISEPIVFTQLSDNINNSLSLIPNYKIQLTFDLYNTKGKIIQATDKNNISTSIIYTQDDLLPIAQFANAKLNQVFYNGFEENIINTNNDKKFGFKAYNGIYNIGGGQLIAGNYQVQYWKKNASNWEFVRVNLVHDGITPIQIGQIGVTIDELAIYPINATFEAVNYNTNSQVVSKSHSNGLGVNFEFNDNGELKLIKDHNGNIISKQEYSIQGND